MTFQNLDQIICKIYILFVLASFLNRALILSQETGPPTPVTPAVKTSVVVPNLPPSHYQFWLKNHPRAFKEFQQLCLQVSRPLDLNNLEHFRALHVNFTFENPFYLTNLEYGKSVLNTICSKVPNVTKSCWGYETNCQIIHLMPECESPTGDIKDVQDKRITWFSQADFGYILDRRREMNKYCSPDRQSNYAVKSSLECTKYFRTCRGEDLYIKFEDIPKNESIVLRDKQDLIKKGNIGGWNCDLQLKRIQEESGQRGALQSWFSELEHYNKLQSDPLKDCDITIDKQAFIIKVDSPYNFYHYFCSFFNLYATIHLNQKFSDDNQIIIWDNQVPKSNYDEVWTAFTRNPLKSINEFEGKRVCFKSFIMTLLPRMVDGLYYGTTLVPGCNKSGLFDAFSKHIIHRMEIPQLYNQIMHSSYKNNHIRIGILSRSTPTRKLMNENNIAMAAQNMSTDYLVRVVDYERFNFRDQLFATHNTDILIGIHGAGLTHSLFLPDWAALIELTDCGDTCYKDLARLRGLSYFTLDKKHVTKQLVDDQLKLKELRSSKLENHEKFSNYVVEEGEFLKALGEAIEEVKKNRKKYFVDEPTLNEPKRHEEL